MYHKTKAAAAAISTPAVSELGMLVIRDKKKKISSLEFDEAVAELTGLGDLIKHHPGLKREAQAIRRIALGDQVLNQIRMFRCQS